MNTNTYWQETKHGLYRQYVFESFREAWNFLQRVSEMVERMDHYPRIQNDRNIVDVWINTHEDHVEVTAQDRELADIIDGLVAPDAKSAMEANDVKESTIVTEVQLYADGGSRGNPGPSASGYVVLNMNNEVLLQAGEFIGTTTNNQAEYQALKLGLEHALHDFQAQEVHVYMDSMLVVNQMRNIFKIKNRELWPIHDACQQLVKRFHKVTFDHVPRELNKIADSEVNKAMDEAIQG